MTESLKTNYTIVMTEEDQAKIIYPERDEKLEQTEVSKAVQKLTPNLRAREFAQHAEKAHISRRLLLAKQARQATVVCSETGIVSLLDIPAVPGFALTYINPISMLENARGLAQRGKKYLRMLDTQILAGILITLANDYSLFRYQPSDSGAQKNAIVRSIHRDTIIIAIELIENSVHSGNHAYLPQFSMIFDKDTHRGELDVRFQFWLQLITDAIYKPDTEVWDENSTVQGKLRAENRQRSKAEREIDAELRKKERELKQDCKLALGLIKDLFKAERISAKLRITLGTIYQEFQLLTMDSAAKALLINKLESIVHPASVTLIEIAKKDRAGLVAKNTPMADFFEDSVPIARVNVVKPDGIVVINVTKPVELVCNEGQQIITIGEQRFVVNSAEYKQLSFIERVKFHKKLVAGEI